jgi:hypothetical protein
LFSLCLLSVWLAAFSSEAACLETHYLWYVSCLSGWLPACRRLLVFILFMYRLLIVSLVGCLLVGDCLYQNCTFIDTLSSVWLAACYAEAACLEVAHSLSVYCHCG